MWGKLRDFESYTNLSRSYGVSVHSLKKTLTAAGYLEGKTPTVTAIEIGVVKMITIGGSRFHDEPAVMPLWNTQAVKTIMESDGVTKCDPESAWSMHSAVNRIIQAANLVDKHFSSKSMPKSIDCSVTIINYYNIDLVCYIEGGEWKSAVLWLKDVRKPIDNYYIRTKYKSENLENAIKKLNGAQNWIEKHL